jgi:Holliday junction resolvasome RuvABC endonuclease subunit
MTGRIQELCAGVGQEYAAIHTGTLKKFAAGSGAAPKERMIELAAEALGRPPIDDNEADAVHLARYAFHEYGVK